MSGMQGNLLGLSPVPLNFLNIFLVTNLKLSAFLCEEISERKLA